MSIPTQLLLLITFKISIKENIWNNDFRKSRVLSEKLVAMVTSDNNKELKITFFDAP